MTFVSKGERVFDFACRPFPNCSPPRPKRSDARLKTYQSILDDRVWSLDENDRYRYLYGLVSGSQTCLTASSCFKYVPLEDLVNLLMAERDEYIKCLERRLGMGVPVDDTPVDELYKAGCFEDDEEQDTLAMRNKIAALTAELEECKITRDNLRQAMHKLEDIDEIVIENNNLKARLRCSEEMIKYLEEKKEKLEKELENLRTKSQIQVDLDNAQDLLMRMRQQEQFADGEDLYCLAKERDNLQKRVCELQSELREAKEKQSELELLKKQSESTTISLEELTKENECYKKKLSTMKCLEMRIQELKNQANSFAEKYKRDVAKASNQDKKMRDICRELNSLRAERDKLRRRVDELAGYECQYNSLQSKLKQVDCIIAENEMLNCKLASLDKLEVENQLLRCKLEKSKASELEAEESKERILELQNAVADQEEEMKDLLCQIERLTRAYGDSNELDKLKEELCKKDCQLKLCEQQLAEMPLLEAEIDELRSKLENHYNDISSPEKKIRTEKSPDEEASDTDWDDSEKDAAEPEVTQEKVDDEKSSMTCEEVQNLLQSSKGIITCVLEDMIEHQREMEELEKCNQEMKDEICLLKAKMGKTGMDDCLQQIAELKRVIQEKELQICCLETQLSRGGDRGKVNDHISNLECEIEYLKDLNRQMREDLEEACREVQRCAELECLLEEERKARIAATAESGKQSRDGDSVKSAKSLKEEYNLETKESSTPLMNEVDDLRNQIEELSKLVEELQKENCLLREGQTPCPDYIREMDEKNALENLLNLLQCELDRCRESSQGEEDLKEEVKMLREQNCQLKSLVNCYNERLNLEKCSKDGSSERSKSPDGSSLREENNRLQSEVTRLRCELIGLCKRIQDNERRMCEQLDEIDKLRGCYCKLAQRNEELEREVEAKDNESQNLKGEVSKLLDETYKLASDNDVLKERLKESESPQSDILKSEGDEEASAEYEEGLTEKHAIETTMRGVEAEVDGLKSKLEECGKAERERDTLLQKQADMEAEIENLRKQLMESKDPSKREDRIGQAPGGLPSAGVPGADKPEAAKPEGSKPDSSRPETAASTPEAKALTEAKAKEEKLLEEMVGMREQSAKLQTEAIEAKAENKKLKSEIDDLKKLLEQCNKEKANEAAQVQLMSSKLEAMSTPMPAQAQGPPQTMIPITEEQRKTVLERGMQGTVSQPPAPKVATIENPPEQLVKVVVEEDPKKQGGLSKVDDKTAPGPPLSSASKPTATPSKGAMLSPSKAAALAGGTTAAKATDGTAPKPADGTAPKPADGTAPKPADGTAPKPGEKPSAKVAEGLPSKSAEGTPSKPGEKAPAKAGEGTSSKPGEKPTVRVVEPTPTEAKPLTPSKAAVLTPSKAAMLTPSKAAMLTPSKAAMLTPSKAAMLTPSKAAMLTPSKAAMLTPSKAAMLTPSKAAMLTPSKAAMAELKSAQGKAPGEKEGAERTGSDDSILSFSEIDPDFCKFLCTLNPDNHKQNICEIERRYMKKMTELQRKNEEKIKRLLEQFEKESKMRDKAHTDSINSMKSGYETDIRKLVERHKASIMRLQSLHEDEVQELNVNYETQLEAMQTQNENIVNDITTGATEKFKMLAEQHNKDVKELERKYQQLLEKKEEEHIRELSSLQNSLTQNMDVVEEYHNKTMSDVTQALEGNITNIQLKHNRELSKMKKSNLKRIDMMKHKYEDLLMCERKKYEKQLEEMVQRLKKGHQVADGTCQCRFTAPCGPRDPNAPLEFNEVLQKILTEGLESLSFNEVALVHRRTCAATEDIVLNPEVKAQLEPPIGEEPCKRNQLMTANKEELLNRILVLENEIAIKQMETQDAIVNMEMAVKAERKRLQDLRESLHFEREKNFELKTKLSGTTDARTVSKTQCRPVREDDIIQKIKEMQKEKCPILPERDTSSNSEKPIVASTGLNKTKSGPDDCKTRQKVTVRKKMKKIPKH